MQNYKSAFAWLICGLGALFYCYEYLLRILPSVIANDLMHAYHIDAAALGNLSAFYYLAYVPMQLPVGILVDHYGPKKLLTLASLICAVSCILLAYNHNLLMAQLARFLAGFGSAFAFVCVMKLATLWLPQSRFALAVGLVMTLSMLGVVGGDIVLSRLLIIMGWPMVVYFLGLTGLIIAVLLYFIIPAKNNRQHLIADTSNSLTASFKQLRIVFTALLQKPSLWLIGIVGCLLYLPISMFAELWAVPYLMRVHGLINQQATEITAMIFLGMAIGSPLIGFISDYTKKRVAPMLVCASLSTLTALIITYYSTINVLPLYILFFLTGLFTAGQTLIFPFARELSHVRVAGTAIAIVNMIVMLGGMLFQPLIGHLLVFITHNNLSGQLSAYSAQDFYYVLLILPGSLFIGAILTLFIKEQPIH